MTRAEVENDFEMRLKKVGSSQGRGRLAGHVMGLTWIIRIQRPLTTESCAHLFFPGPPTRVIQCKRSLQHLAPSYQTSI